MAGILACAALASGCAFRSVAGLRDLVALSERQEIAVGREGLDDLARSPGTLAHGDAALLVARVGFELAAVAPGAPYPYTFHILDTPAPNAFALPGGVVVVTRGLLAVLADVDELAGVLGHEIGHVAARHPTARLALSLPSDALAALLRFTVGSLDARTGAALAAALPRAIIAPYARHQEREADVSGVALAASAGYDPSALGRVLSRLARLGPSGDGGGGWLASHPTTAARAELIAAVAATLERGPRPAPADYLCAVDGLTVGEDPARGIIAERTALLPMVNAAVSLPAGWFAERGDDGIVAVHASGSSLRVAVTSRARALREQEELQAEEGFVELVDAGRLGAWSVTRGALRYGKAVPSLKQSYWLSRDERSLVVSGDFAAAERTTYEPLLDALIASLREPSAAELAKLETLRLRAVEAAPGETLLALVQRTQSAWSAAEVAAYNGVDEPLAPVGGRLKIARREPLVGAGR